MSSGRSTTLENSVSQRRLNNSADPNERPIAGHFLFVMTGRISLLRQRSSANQLECKRRNPFLKKERETWATISKNGDDNLVFELWL